MNEPQKREEIRKQLDSEADAMVRKILTEIGSFRPLGIMRDLAVVMGVQPKKGVPITIMGATYVFKANSKPSEEQVALWEREHAKADALRKNAVDYLWHGFFKPNTTIGNYRVVEHGKRLEAQGLLSDEEIAELRKLEAFYDEYPQLKDPDSPDNRDHWGLVTKDGKIRMSSPLTRHPGYEANIRNERINTIGLEEEGML